jgi:hypothetical protein
VVDFLVGASVCCCAIIRETMGKGNGVDERHGMEKEATVG